ncbi:Cocaine esterase [Bienertia sinuspersici]
MAMQTGIGLSRLVFLVGAGYTGTILVKNGKLSDIIGELQALVKGMETSGDSTNADSDPMAVQLRWLAQEVRQLASSRQITVVNGGGSGGTDISSLILPAATLGALGYGYMWWKGLSFSDLMYVTKRNMATAVANLTSNLDNIKDRLSKVKLHLTQRIENLDGKIDEQREMSKLIMNEVKDTRGDIDKVTSELYHLRNTVFSLEDKMCSFEDKQHLTLMGVEYLVQFVDGKTVKVPSQHVQEQLKGAGKSRPQLPSSDALGLQGLKEIAEGTVKEIRSIKDVDDQPTRNLMRSGSVKSSRI